MSHLSDPQLLNLNRQGIIPGPGESAAAFMQRADYCLTIKENFPNRLDMHLEEAPEQVLEEGFSRVEEAYGIRPSWVPVFFSNYKLAPWHGGCAWIFQLEEDSPVTAMFQLRKTFKDRAKLHGLYHRTELIAHESAHVGRMLFEEPKFEEFFAYYTSFSPFRRYCGPIAQSSMETMWFVVVILAILLMDFYFLFSGQTALYFSTMWIKAVPLGMVLLAIGRLIYRHYRFNRCLQKVKQAVPNRGDALRVTYRLTDDEILAFGKKTPEEIQLYFSREAKRELRSQLIHTAYFQQHQQE